MIKEALAPSGGAVDEVAPRSSARTGHRAAATKRVPTWVYQWGVAIGSLAVVEVLSRSGLLSEYIPAPSDVIVAFFTEIVKPMLWVRIGDTMASWAVGLAIAVAVGIPVGLVIGSTTAVYRSVRLIVEFLRPIPPVAILPLAVLLYGSGMQMKVFLVAFSAFWLVLFQTIYGVRDVDPVTRDSVRAYGLSRADQFRRVVLPSAAFYIATGLRLAATTGLIVTIATELIVGSSGLGFAINQERFAGNLPAMYALVIVAGLLGLAVSTASRITERRVLHWHSAHRKADAA